jgi:hypothetical protein
VADTIVAVVAISRRILSKILPHSFLAICCLVANDTEGQPSIRPWVVNILNDSLDLVACEEGRLTKAKSINKKIKYLYGEERKRALPAQKD